MNIANAERGQSKRSANPGMKFCQESRGERLLGILIGFFGKSSIICPILFSDRGGKWKKKKIGEYLSYVQNFAAYRRMRNDSLVILSLCLEVMLNASCLSLSDKFWRLLKSLGHYTSSRFCSPWK